MPHRPIRIRFPHLFALTALALGLGACGGSDDGAAPAAGGALTQDSGAGGTAGTGAGGTAGTGAGGTAGTGAGGSAGTGAGGTDAGAAGSGDGGPGGTMGDAPQEVDCTGKPDGTDCGGGSICIQNMCLSSRCGDGFVDKTTGEDCEDGNAVAGDGCSKCRFDCANDGECDDKNVCTGTETCDKSVAGKQSCKAGTAAPDATACTLTDGAGSCKGGTCVKAGCGNGMKDGTEECDDGNADDTDGCTRMCTFTCKDNPGCDDGNACNGAETCNVTEHKCVAGTAVTCPGMGCTGTCVPATGKCTYADADKDGKACDVDCNDADPAVFPGGFECKDGKDNDCSAATADATAPGCECYVDVDKDGYAASVANSIAAAGACPAGYTRRKPEGMANIDCGPRVASANPAQTDFFPTPYCVLGLCPKGTGSFDYNCDTIEERFDATTAAATCVGAVTVGLCAARSGWVGAVPMCGGKGTYRQCTFTRGSGCSGTDIANRSQDCR
jgi:cysteine-rich repeat protein